MKKYMNADLYDKVITDKLVFGKPVDKIAEEIGCGETTVSNTLTIFKVVKANDWAKCIEYINKQYPIAPFIWAARKLDIELPKEVYDAYDMRAKKRAEAQKPEVKEVPKEQPKEEAKNNDLFFIKLLEAVNKQNELLEQLLDTVLPHWVNDMKDNMNVNADVICERLKNVEQAVETIKQNTRRRGA